MWRRILLSTLVVSVAGSLLHFVWAWSGHNPVVAVFAAVNESTWEHLKLAFWPALFVTPFQLWFYGPEMSWLPGTAVRCLLSPALIVVFFYGYVAILGDNFLAVDISIFVFAVFIAELAGHRILSRRTSRIVKVYALVALTAGTAAFSTFTYFPPDAFLFEDPLGPGHEYGPGSTPPPPTELSL